MHCNAWTFFIVHAFVWGRNWGGGLAGRYTAIRLLEGTWMDRAFWRKGGSDRGQGLVVASFLLT